MSKSINRTFNQIKSDILKCFQQKPNWFRKEIINECLKNFNLSEDELKNYDSSSTLIKSKSMIGSVISSMLNNKDLSIDNGKVITLGREDNILIRDSQVEIFVKEYFTSNKTSNYEDLFEKASIEFKTNTTTSLKDDEELKQALNSVLTYLLETDYLSKNNDTYSFKNQHPYPNTEIGNCLNSCYYSNDPYKHFIQAININGGEFLEQFSVALLSKYFQSCNSTLIKNTVTGGSNDGGLDGIIEIVDELGYFERIYIQTKARNKVLVTVKELREFYGALMVENGTRGIFVTNSFYHPHAQEFISKADNLIGIDGNKLYDLALKCNYGLILNDNKIILDEHVFIGGLK